MVPPVRKTYQFKCLQNRTEFTQEEGLSHRVFVFTCSLGHMSLMASIKGLILSLSGGCDCTPTARRDTHSSSVVLEQNTKEPKTPNGDTVIIILFKQLSLTI